MPAEKRCAIEQFFPAPQVLDDPEAFEKSIELFQREGAQLDRLGTDSTQIPQLFAYLEQERRFYLIQEFIDGQNLLKELDRMLMNEVQDRHQSIACIIAALASPPVDNWRLKAMVSTGILSVTTTGLVVYSNQEQIECRLGGHNSVCPAPIAKLVPQSPQKIGNVLYYPYLSAKDSRGKSAEINMAVLSDRYEWQLGSDDRVRLKGQTQSIPMSVIKHLTRYFRDFAKTAPQRLPSGASEPWASF